MNFKAVFVLCLILCGIFFFGCTLQQSGTMQLVNQSHFIPTNASVTVIPSIKQNATLQNPAATNMTPPLQVVPRTEFNFTNVTDSNGRLVVYFFYSSYCEACRSILNSTLKLEQKYNSTTDWQLFDISTEAGGTAYREYVAQENLSILEQYIPQVMVNRTLLINQFNVSAGLEPILAGYAPVILHN